MKGLPEMDEERRMNLRYAYIEQVTLVTEDEQSFIVKSENLSIGGVYIITEYDLPKGSEGHIILVINQNNEKRCLSAEYIVVHNRLSLNGLKGIGIEFTDISLENKRILRELIIFLDEK